MSAKKVRLILVDESDRILGRPRVQLDVTVEEFINDAIKHLNLPRKTPDGVKIDYQLIVNGKPVIDPLKRFEDLKISDGAKVVLSKKLVKERKPSTAEYFTPPLGQVMKDLREKKTVYQKPPIKPQHKSLALMLVISIIIAGVAFGLGYSAKAPETRTVSKTYHYTRTTTMVKTITLTKTVTLRVAVKPLTKIRIDGDDSDWQGISPIYTEHERNLSRDNYRLGVADIKEVFLADDGKNLYFLVRFWDPVNFNLNPKRGEILTILCVNIYVRGQEPGRPLLHAQVDPLWGRLARFVGADLDKDGRYGEEGEPLYEMPLAYRNSNVEFSIPIGLIYETSLKVIGTRTNRITLVIYSNPFWRTDGGWSTNGLVDMIKIPYELP